MSEVNGRDADMCVAETLVRRLFGVGIEKFDRLGGLTNRSYRVILQNGKTLAIRIPGEGTDAIIDRSDECVSTTLGSALGVDSVLHYFGRDGVKVMDYIPNAETMASARLCEPGIVRLVAANLRKLHSSGVDTGVRFAVFEMAERYRKFIVDRKVPLFDGFDEMNGIVQRVKQIADAKCDIHMAPCHCDPLCENWILDSKADRLYLIDWEYAGMTDAMWDLADVSIEAGYTKETDDLLLREYLCRPATDSQYLNFAANKIYLDYLWSLWGKTRVPFDGKSMEEYAMARWVRMKANVELFRSAYGLDL